jgi:patatin-like phospholipase/acyl hydrolase
MTTILIIVVVLMLFGGGGVRGSVHLSRQFLEKLTDSAIIKVALPTKASRGATHRP